MTARALGDTDPLEMPVIRLPKVFIDNAFQRRLADAFEFGLSYRTKQVVGAVSGAGKTSGLKRLKRTHPVVKNRDGTTRAPVLVGVSTDEEERSAKALIDRLLRPLGPVPNLAITALEDYLIDQMHDDDTDLLALDDSQDFRYADLRRLKKIADRLDLEYDREVGLCLLVASEGETIPLKDVLVDTKIDTFRQFRGRFSAEEPWRYVPALSREEVPEALDGLDQVLSAMLPGFCLEPSSDRIYGLVAHDEFFTQYGTERVTMRTLKTIALAVARRWASGDGGPITERLVDDTVAAVRASGLRVSVVGGGDMED